MPFDLSIAPMRMCNSTLLFWQGIYLYGSVGSGKTMIMDLAFQVMEEHKVVPRMRRVHFNDALNELHQRLHKLETARAQLPRHEVKQYAEAVAKHEADTQQAPSVAVWTHMIISFISRMMLL